MFPPSSSHPSQHAAAAQIKPCIIHAWPATKDETSDLPAYIIMMCLSHVRPDDTTTEMDYCMYGLFYTRVPDAPGNTSHFSNQREAQKQCILDN
jgi:hypothetical protein